ncbi:MAG TPA: aminotransferase class I/II-fold pyridoxal phosphate-dependent enzyme [Kofleriaceae bacterium]
MTERLSYGRQTIDEADIAAVVDALRSPYLTAGPLVGKFEAALARWLGASHAVACASGTAALHLAYAALGIGEGDEIITSPITFSATAAAAYYVGARVRIADVDPRSGNLTPASVEPLITARTRAIVPVHLAGVPADLDELLALARHRRLRVIEDACHALGATYHGRLIGADAAGPGHPASDAVVLSFHPVKHITTAEGGAVIVRDPDTHRRLERLRSHGIERDPARFTAHPHAAPWLYEVQELGWNYRLPDLACALGLSQLAKLGQFVEARRRLAACYRAELAAAFGEAGRALTDAGVHPPPEFADRSSAYHLFAVAIDFPRYRTTRARVMQALADAGIGTQVHYIPLLDHPLHARRCPDELGRPRPGADHYYARTLSLPIYPTLTPGDVRRVVHELHRILLGEAP